VWRLWSLAAEVDVTWGLIPEFARALNVSPAELEGPGALRLGLSAQRRCVM
jgi:hypothetical protein